VVNIASNINTKIKQIAFWPVRLSNDVLESLSKSGLMGKIQIKYQVFPI
jgi:hypothetical protein